MQPKNLPHSELRANVRQQRTSHNLGIEMASTTSDDDSFDENLVEKWKPITTAIVDAVKRAASQSPQLSPTSSPQERLTFQKYWYHILDQVLDSVASDRSIPEFVTKPPVKKFAIKLFDKAALENSECSYCPCILPDVEPTILLSDDVGVRNLDLAKGLRDYLYRDDSKPVIYTLVGRSQQEVEDARICGPVLHDANWMSSGTDKATGDRMAYPWHDQPTMFMYCRPVSEKDPEDAVENAGDTEQSADTANTMAESRL